MFSGSCSYLVSAHLLGHLRVRHHCELTSTTEPRLPSEPTWHTCPTNTSIKKVACHAEGKYEEEDVFTFGAAPLDEVGVERRTRQ